MLKMDARNILLLAWGMVIVLIVGIQGAYTLSSGQNRSVWARVWLRRPSTAAPRLSARVIGGMLLAASLGFLIVLIQKFMEFIH
jgi:hypothetical protein